MEGHRLSHVRRQFFVSVFFGFGGSAVFLVALGLDVFDVGLGLVVLEDVLDVVFGADVVLGWGTGACVVVGAGGGVYGGGV